MAAEFRGERALKQRRKLRGRQGRLTILEKISVVHLVLCEGEYYRDVAQKYPVTEGFISNLVKKVKKNPDYFEELLKLRDEKSAERD